MSKKNNLMKGFNNLLQSTETSSKESITVNTAESVDVLPPKSIDVLPSEKSEGDTLRHIKQSKYKELKKCTLYLPPELMDSLAIMKVKTKKDLSVLAAEALNDYLEKHNFLNV